MNCEREGCAQPALPGPIGYGLCAYHLHAF
jgi:hypothetical protein